MQPVSAGFKPMIKMIKMIKLAAKLAGLQLATWGGRLYGYGYDGDALALPHDPSELELMTKSEAMQIASQAVAQSVAQMALAHLSLSYSQAQNEPEQVEYWRKKLVDEVCAAKPLIADDNLRQLTDKAIQFYSCLGDCRDDAGSER